MSVYDFAMQMELDGKQYYTEQAAKTGLPELRDILLQLAQDEQRHYEIFRALKEGRQAEYVEKDRTTILRSVKNVFDTLKAQNKDFQFPPDARGVWVKAQEIEKKSEDFYREKADEVGDEDQKRILHKIADEERRHWITIEHVIQFLDRPHHWLEDAEWNNLEDF